MHKTFGRAILVLDKVQFKKIIIIRDKEIYLLISQFIKNINI